jgi:hypothetical protein
MIDQQGMNSEVIGQFLSHFAVGQNHELFHHLLWVYSLLKANIDRHFELIQLKNNLVLIENIAIASRRATTWGNRLQDLQLFFQFDVLLSRQRFLLLDFALVNLRVNDAFGLFIGQLSPASNNSLFEASSSHISLDINGEKRAKSQSSFIGPQSQQVDEFRRHHMKCFMRKIDGSSLVGDLPLVN